MSGIKWVKVGFFLILGPLGACASGGGGGGTGLKFPATVNFLIAGQSNGSSTLQNSALQTSLAQTEPPYVSLWGNVTINDYYRDNSYFTPTAARPATGGLAWCYLADLVPSHKFFITNVSWAGRSTQQQIDLHLYQTMLDALAVRHYDAVLWVQGESDSGLGMTELQTYNNMVQIITLSRLTQSDLVWYVALDSSRGLPTNNPTRQAQALLIQNGYALPGPDVDTMRNNSAFVEASGGEFAGQGLHEHGRLWFEALKYRF